MLSRFTQEPRCDDTREGVAMGTTQGITDDKGRTEGDRQIFCPSRGAGSLHCGTVALWEF